MNRIESISVIVQECVCTKVSTLISFQERIERLVDLVCSVCLMNELNLTLVCPSIPMVVFVLLRWGRRGKVGNPLLRDFRKAWGSGGWGKNIQSIPWWYCENGRKVCVYVDLLGRGGWEVVERDHLKPKKKLFCRMWLESRS